MRSAAKYWADDYQVPIRITVLIISYLRLQWTRNLWCVFGSFFRPLFYARSTTGQSDWHSHSRLRRKVQYQSIGAPREVCNLVSLINLLLQYATILSSRFSADAAAEQNTRPPNLWLSKALAMANDLLECFEKIRDMLLKVAAFCSEKFWNEVNYSFCASYQRYSYCYKEYGISLAVTTLNGNAIFRFTTSPCLLDQGTTSSMVNQEPLRWTPVSIRFIRKSCIKHIFRQLFRPAARKKLSAPIFNLHMLTPPTQCHR